jgi:hypothetical protein
MDFLVEFQITVPEGTPTAEVQARQDGQSQLTSSIERNRVEHWP